jgi:hypothetical protein
VEQKHVGIERGDEDQPFGGDQCLAPRRFKWVA